MKKHFSILLSFVLLASHLYVAIGTHFCGGESVESKMIWTQMHLGCEMSVDEEPCDDAEANSTKEVSFDESPCCGNEYQMVHLDHEFLKDAAQTVFNVDFAVVYIYSGLGLGLLPNSPTQIYKEFKSPPIEKDIQVLFQTFLI